MLEIIITEKEFYQQSENTFIQVPACTLTLEHSLISLAKWESKWQQPYFDGKPKTITQDLDYIRCMVIGTVKNDLIFRTISPEEMLQIQNYMSDPMTATTFQTTPKNKTRKDIMTADVIYAHMFTHKIPLECHKWHLNRLLTLLKVCDLQNAPKDKMTKRQTTMWNAEQNAARRAKYNTRG